MKTRIHVQGEKGYTNSTSMRSVFKPLIASSLALALGVSVAMATDPSIQTSTNGTLQSLNIAGTGVSWNRSNGEGTNSFYTLIDSSNTTPANIVFQFTNNGNDTGSLSGDTYTISQNGTMGANQTPILQFSTTDRGIDMREKTLTFNFLATDEGGNADWNSVFDETNPKTRKMVLNLSGVTQEKGESVSLKGNLEVKAGMGTGAYETKKPFEYKNSNVFEATFGGNVIGDITIDPSDIKDSNILDPSGTPYADGKHRDITTTFTFNSGASLQGDILANTGINTFTFKSGNIIGNITADNGVPSDNKNWIAGTDNEYYGAINKITFSENGSIIGDITASNSGQNIVTFNSSGTIHGNILSGRNEKFLSSSSNHNNFIVFKGASAEITNASLKIINGNDPSGNGNGKFSNNILLSSSTTTTNIQLSSMSVNGDYGPTSPGNKTFNIIDLEGDNNSLTINSIRSVFGINIIAKGLVSDTNTENGVFNTTLNSVYYNDDFFEINEADFLYYKVKSIKLKDNITTEFLKSKYSAEGDFILGEDNTKNAINTDKGGINLININGTTVIKGNILSSVPGTSSGGSGHNNILFLTGKSATLGEDGNNKISIKVNNGAVGYGYYSNNTIIFGADTNTLNLSELNATGDWKYPSTNSDSKSFNILSFNNTTNNGVKRIDAVVASFGNNIIGKDVITQENGYSSLLFDKGGTDTQIKSNFAAEFMKNTYQAKGTYTIGTSGNTGDVLITNSGGNYINVESLTIHGNIKSSGGGNYIYANTLALNGGISASGASTNSFNLTNSTSNQIKGNITNNNSSNIINAIGQTLTLGDSNKKISIETSGGGTARNTFTADTINAYISTLTARGNGYSDNDNTLTASSGTIAIDSLSASGGSSNKNQNILTFSGNGTFSIGTISANQHGVNTISFGRTGIINGNITTNGNNAETNFTLKADDATLTLKGANSAITTLTAKNDATNGNVLILDASLNNNVEASITTLANGGKLKVDFKGAEGKTTKLTLNTTTNQNLKSVSATNGIDNTLAPTGTNTMTIADAVTIGETSGNKKGVIFDLHTGSSLTFTNNLTTNAQGIVSFNLGGTSNTITGALSNSGVNNFNLASATTLQYGSNGLSFSSGENDLNFVTGTSTLDWKNSDGTALKNISTTGGVTNFNLVDSANATITTGSQITTSGGIANINFNGTSSLTVNSIETSGSGTTNINFNSVDGTLSTGVTASGGSTNINIANGKSGTINGNVTGNGVINFASGSNDSSLTLSGGGNEVKTLKMIGNSTNNALKISTGKTSITSQVEVKQGQGITFDLTGTAELNLAGGMITSGNSVISVSNASTGATVSGSTKIDVSKISLGDSSKITFATSDFTADSLSAGSDTELVVGKSGNATVQIHEANIDIKTITLGGTDGTLALGGGTQTIETLTTTTQGTLTLNNTNTTITNDVSGVGKLNLDLSNSTLSLKGTNNTIKSLSGNGTIDLAMADSEGNPLARSVKARSGFKTLTLDGKYSGNSTFNLYVNSKQSNGQPKADKVVFGNDSTGTATITVTGNIDDIMAIKRSDNVIVAQTISNGTSPSFIGGTSLIGYDVIQATLTQEGNMVYLEQAIAKGVAPEIKEVASSALAVNYDLFLANFNSLNKRMGELRDNPYSQGVWARVYGGAMSNDFGAGSKTEYVTAQGGYDYALTLGDAKNYIGVALAYGHSTTKSNTLEVQASQGASIALQDVKSNMVEVGVYNSYIADNGWYNDTIFKFDYIMSSFTMTDNLSLESKTNNFAMILSDEFGYRYQFGENEKGSWYIDPQVEIAFGYFNQSDFNRAMVTTNSTLQASQDSILNLRSRAGLSLGKKFNTERGFASVYVGAFYEYDYIEGGNAEVLSKSGIANPLDKLESNGRAIVNIGSNIELIDGVRMYIDVEKSFGDKQRTFMQFNLGARYSFGEKAPTISYQEAQNKNTAPLKIEEKKEDKGESTSKDTQGQQSKTNVDSAENKTEETAQ